MNQADFERVLCAQWTEICELLKVKGGEYAGETDRLGNFKRGAELTGTTPLQCLFIYMSKHYDAVATFIRDDARGVARPRSESIEGRLSDLINYCILARALLVERGSPPASERAIPKNEPPRDRPVDPDRLPPESKPPAAPRPPFGQIVHPDGKSVVDPGLYRPLNR